MIQIDSGYFCAGVIFNDDDTVMFCAPIIKYMIGWTKSKVKAYCQKKNWKINYEN